MAATAPSRRDRRRALRAATKRRVRGGERRAPVAVQRAARTIDDAVFRATGRFRRVFAGDRPFLLGFLGLVAVGVLVISGPLQSYLDQRDRVELLEEQKAVLDQANAQLEQRSSDLQDPSHLKQEARERLGYIEPGEVPYVVVPPEQDPSTITQPLDLPKQNDDRSFVRRAWDSLTGWFG
jgi:cell division protein DivIC